MEKFDIFLEVARALNKSLAVTPVLYGSLGLRKLLKKEIEVHDIDILVPQEFIGDKWEELKNLMETLGFALSDPHEHEFTRNGERVAFASLAALEDIGENSDNLHDTTVAGTNFKELTAPQYLKAYRFSLRDGYRLAARSDQKKIDLIESSLAEKHD